MAKYKILSKIGEGGMGAVYKVQRHDGTILAMKKCSFMGEEYRKRFARECRAMQKVNHPNVVKILATSLNRDDPFFLMPLASQSLQDITAQCSKNHTLAMKYFLQICSGVQAIHDAGCVHRDLKPENILIMDGTAMVSDFGLAKFVSRTSSVLTRTNIEVGTAMYAAPEQGVPGGSRDADARTDVYQLGKTLFKILTSEDPILMDFSELPSGLRYIVRKATNQHPGERYQSVAELMDAVTAYEASLDPNNSPLETFNAVCAVAIDRATSGEFRVSEAKKLLDILSLSDITEDSAQFLQLFDEIPKGLLGVMAQKVPDLLASILQHYVRCLEDVVGSYPFPYAESVAARMKQVVRVRPQHSEAASLALEANLVSAVRLNRFAAIASFNELLCQIKDGDTAASVADMLKRRLIEYQRICEGADRLKLHPAIRSVRDIEAAK